MDDKEQAAKSKRSQLRQSMREERRERMQTRRGIGDDSSSRSSNLCLRDDHSTRDGATSKAMEAEGSFIDSGFVKDPDAGNSACDTEKAAPSGIVHEAEFRSVVCKIQERASARNAKREERRKKTDEMVGYSNGDDAGIQDRFDLGRNEDEHNTAEMNATEKCLRARQNERRIRLDRRIMEDSEEEKGQSNALSRPARLGEASEEDVNNINAAEKRLVARQHERRIRLESRSVNGDENIGGDIPRNAQAVPRGNDINDVVSENYENVNAAEKRLRARRNERQIRLGIQNPDIEESSAEVGATDGRTRYRGNVVVDVDQISIDIEPNQVMRAIDTRHGRVESSWGNEGIPDDDRVGAFAVWEEDEAQTSYRMDAGSTTELNGLEGSDDVSHRQNRHVEDAQILPLDAHVPPNVSEGGDENVLVVEGRREKSGGRGVSKKKKLLAAGAVILVLIIGGSFLGAVLRLRPSLSGISNELAPTVVPISEEDTRNAILSFLANTTIGKDVFEPGSFYEAAGKWMVDDDPFQLQLDSPNLLQRFALVLFYLQSTNGFQRTWKRCNPPLPSEDNICHDVSIHRWLTGTHECTWAGIGCIQDTVTVDVLDFRRFGIIGQMPHAVALLSNLRGLDLSINGFTGSFPEEIYSITSLEFLLAVASHQSIAGTLSTRLGLLTNLLLLSFSSNVFSGTIPSEIGKLSELRSLSLGINQRIDGTIPKEMFRLTNLTGLSISNTSITGTLSKRIGKLSNLQALDLSFIMISGLIPSEIGLCSQLSAIYFGDSAFSGQLPSEIGELKFAWELTLTETLLTGTLPEEFFEMTALERLNAGSPIEGTLSTMIGRLTKLSYFAISETNLGGSIATEIGLLSNLILLILRNNVITGQIPSEFGLCTLLRDFELFGNELTGSLPSSLGMMRSLENIWLQNNQGINGTIPVELFNLDQLDLIEFGNLSLSGTLNTLIGNLKSLEIINLEYNSLLTGEIPSEFGLVPELRAIALPGTGVFGTIPTELGLASNFHTLVFFNTSVVGPVPDEVCALSPFLHMWADCLPIENPSVACACCTHCCDRETGTCDARSFE